MREACSYYPASAAAATSQYMISHHADDAAPRARSSNRAARAALGALLCLTLATSGCSSLFSEGAATSAGIAGTAVAGKLTHNATVAAGIGLGVLAAANAGVKYVEKDYHGDQQDQIAAIAGPLPTGQVAPWASRHSIQLEPDAQGKVTVSRVIGASELNCKEIVFSVDTVKKQVANSDFYVATICKDGDKWKWASAEPATERWGSLQ
jgi:hypothetical protein